MGIPAKLKAASEQSASAGVLDSADAYWKSVNDGWDDLLNIIAHHIDLNSPAHDIPGDGTSPLTMRTVLEELIHLKKTQDPKIVRYFAAAWCLASDAYAWSVPFWGSFCDLCSEEWVLQGDEEPDVPDIASLTGR